MKIIKLVTLLLVTITLVGFNADDILDDNSPSWNIDNDSDGLPNALEDILGSNKEEKDSNMNLTDDKDELDGLYRYKLNDNYINNSNYDKNYITVSDYNLLQVSKMSSENLNEDCIGKTVKEVFNDRYKELNEFIIVRYQNGDKGFGGIAIRKDNNIIIGYKPSRSYIDWIENFTIQFRPHPQRKYAIEFIKPIVNKNDNIYITGHSLGGLLAQYATYYLYNEGYENIKTVTFNSASTLNPKHMKGKYGPPILKDNLKEGYKQSYLKLIPKKDDEGNYIIVDTSYLVDFLNESIKEKGFIDIDNKVFKESDFEEFNNIVTNYIISSDPIYLIVNGEYLGEKKIINVKEEELDFIKDKNKLSEYHALENFIDILN